jgi:hypothetical protein
MKKNPGSWGFKRDLDLRFRVFPFEWLRAVGQFLDASSLLGRAITGILDRAFGSILPDHRSN